MRTVALLLCLILPATAEAACNFSGWDKFLLGSFYVLEYADANTSIYCQHHYPRPHPTKPGVTVNCDEANPLLSQHPSDSEFWQYTIAAAIAVTYVACKIPPGGWRKVWLLVANAAEYATVQDNLSQYSGPSSSQVERGRPLGLRLGVGF